MKQSYIKILLSTLALIITATGCSTKSVPRTENAAAVDTKIHAPATVAASNEDLKQINLTTINDDLKKATTDSQLKAILLRLSPFVMNANYVEDRTFSTTPELRAMLSSYNSTILKLNQIKPTALNDTLSDKYETGILATYLKFILSGCDQQLKDCQNISFFSTDPQSARIIQIQLRTLDSQITQSKLAQQGKCLKDCFENIAQYYKLIGLAYDLRNAILDHDLEFLYLKHSREYAEYFDQLPQNQKDENLLERHTKIFEKIIASYQPDVNDPDFASFVNNFSPWTYSRLEANPFPHGTARMFNFAAQTFLYDKQSHQLSAPFLEALKNSQEKEDRFGKSFSQILANLKESNSALLSLLSKDESQLQNSLLSNEYFFMIDRLYRGHLNSDEVKQIWSGSKKDVKLFLATIQYYLKVNFIKTMLETNQGMREIYQKKEYAAATMFTDIVQKSQYVSERWMDMLTRFSNLANFMNESLKQDGIDTPEMRQTNDIFASIKRNIKYISVYPNMMIFVYQMVDQNAILDIKGSAGNETKLDTSDLGKRLFLTGEEAAKQEPWFNFADDQVGLNRTEMLFAYNFALVTKTFEVFDLKLAQDKNAVSNLRKLYFEKVIKPFLNDDVEQFRRDAINYENSVNSGINYQNFTQHTCSQLANKDFNFQFNTKEEDINYFAITGVATTNSPTEKVQEIYSNSASPGTELPNLTNNLMIKITMIETMTDILDRDLTSLGWSVGQRTDFLKDIKKQVEDTKAEITNYINLATKYHSQISVCLSQLYKMEIDREKELIANEEIHLGGIHEVMKWMQSDSNLKSLNIQASGINEAQFQKIVSALKSQNKIPNNYDFTLGRDLITKDYYTLQKLELLHRVKAAQNKMKPRVQVQAMSEAEETNTPSYAISTDVKYQSDKNAFLQDALQVSFNANVDTDGGLQWLKSSNLAKVQTEKIRTLRELYKFESTFDLKYNAKIQASELIDEQLKLARIFNIDDSDLTLFSKIRATAKYTSVDYDHILIDATSGVQVSLLENLFLDVSTNDGLKNEAESFAKSVLNVGQFLFQPSKEVSQLMRSHYRPLVKNVDLMVRDFIVAVHKKEKADTLNPITQIRFNFDRGTALFYVTPKLSDNSPIYLNPNIITNYLSDYSRFMKTTTNQYYAPQRGDAECLADPKILTCGSN